MYFYLTYYLTYYLLFEHIFTVTHACLSCVSPKTARVNLPTNLFRQTKSLARFRSPIQHFTLATPERFIS